MTECLQESSEVKQTITQPQIKCTFVTFPSDFCVIAWINAHTNAPAQCSKCHNNGWSLPGSVSAPRMSRCCLIIIMMMITTIIILSPAYRCLWCPLRAVRCRARTCGVKATVLPASPRPSFLLSPQAPQFFCPPALRHSQPS